MCQRHEFGVELGTGAFVDFEQGFFAVQRRTISARLQHRLVRVGQRNDARTERQPLATQFAGSIAAIEAVVMVTDNRHQVRQKLDGANHVGADDRVIARLLQFIR